LSGPAFVYEVGGETKRIGKPDSLVNIPTLHVRQADTPDSPYIKYRIETVNTFPRKSRGSVGPGSDFSL
jgi:hypothetical protein